MRGRPSTARRCALCHDAAADDLTLCTGCGTLTHDACSVEAGGVCPTLGCRAQRGTTARPWRPQPERWRALHDAIASAVEVSITILALFAPALVVGGLWLLLALK